MPPKNKSKPKDESGPAKLKPATSINVRHILCEKHSNKEKALARLIEGDKFDDVAKDLSEDKARQGPLFVPLLLDFIL
jgi:NIMA-interacting peptidyl-prolyl cis-trans isomerase 4